MNLKRQAQGAKSHRVERELGSVSCCAYKNNPPWGQSNNMEMEHENNMY
jgi:hypothetical protein